MTAILKVLVTLGVIVGLLKRRISIGNAMLAGAGVIFVISGAEWAVIARAGRELLVTSSTWEIMVALYLVMCLEHQLRTQGIIDGLMAAVRSRLKSDKLLLVLMPAFLGFLPSLGGAIFSAPLVEGLAKPYNLSPERKAGINYWFRHLWECTNPILPGLLLASQIAQVAINDMIGGMLWVTVLCWGIGWLLYLTPVKMPLADGEDTIVSGEAKFKYVLLAAGPIIANFVLVVAFAYGPALSMLVVVVAMTAVLRLKFRQIGTMLTSAFDRKLLWGIVGILFFQYMLKHIGIIGEVAQVLKETGVSLLLVISTVGFLAGILTGSSQGYVAITFPLIAAASLGNLEIAMAAYIAGFAGQMLSPAHLCLLITVEYFKADFLKALRGILLMESVVLAVLAIKMIL